MFGLMTPRHQCGTSPDTHQQYRQHYCGVCKSMGTSYGQTSRVFLNFDTVFLAELLTELSGGAQFPEHTVGKCFTLPESAEKMPLSTRYAAAVNVVLTHLKIQDNLWDAASLKWKMMGRLFKHPAYLASVELETLGKVAVPKMEALCQIQQVLESSPTTDFEELAQPTSRMTAMVFEGGAQAICKPQLDSVMGELGNAFGAVVYWLDALEDWQKDQKTGEFNPIRLAGTEAEGLQRVQAHLRKAEMAIHASMPKLPLDAAVIERFLSRLSANVSLRTHRALHPSPSIWKSQTWRDAWRKRWAEAKSFAHSAVMGPSVGLRYYTFMIVAAMVPQVQDAITPGQDARQKLTALGLLTAMLATIGLGKKAHKKCCKPASTGGIKRHQKTQDPCPCDSNSCDGCGDACGNCNCDGCSNCCSSEACSACGDCCLVCAQNPEPAGRAAVCCCEAADDGSTCCLQSKNGNCCGCNDDCWIACCSISSIVGLICLIANRK